jgi:putative transposase
MEPSPRSSQYNPDYLRRRSIRLRDYDYYQAGAYFVTICAHERERLFGYIDGSEMHLSEFGEIVKYCWDRLPEHFRGVELDAFTIMPNHIHLVLVLFDPDSAALVRRKSKLGTVIGSLKAATANRINKLRGTQGAPVWQRNYHEHIVRNERELSAIRDYIAHNPENWVLDPEYQMSLS